jgi:hypothetical protein
MSRITEVDVGIVADIASDATKSVVLDLELASAVPTPKQLDEKPAAVAHRARHQRAFHVRIARDDALVVLILFPRDLAVMVISNNHFPLVPPTRYAPGDHLAPTLEPNPTAIGVPLWGRILPSLAGIAAIVVMLRRYYLRAPAAVVEIAE